MDNTRQILRSQQNSVCLRTTSTTLLLFKWLCHFLSGKMTLRWKIRWVCPWGLKGLLVWKIGSKFANMAVVHIWGGSERKSMHNFEKWCLRGKWVQYEIICLILFFENMRPCEKKFIFDHKCNFGPIRPPRNAKIGFNPVQKWSLMTRNQFLEGLIFSTAGALVVVTV